MALITISRGTFSGGKGFAEKFADKLGYRCLSREELSEEAVKRGVPVGRLQTAMVKPPRVAKRLGPEREMYLACITHLLCGYALEGNMVYHGHTGHLLLPGIPHILRIRILSDIEFRLNNVMNRLRLERGKALEYVRNVDSDRDKWVRFLYGVDWHEPLHYDAVINLAQMGVSNVSTALCNMAEMPDFVMTPSATKALQNLRLSSGARFLLSQDRRTGFADFRVTADEGKVQVTCMPHQAEAVQYVEEVLKELEDCREVRCTIAGSNILWLGEKFNPDSELYSNLVNVARKWDAAVEVMRYAGAEDSGGSAAEDRYEVVKLNAQNGGIEDDVEEKSGDSGSGIPLVLDLLSKEGYSGGSSTLYGEKESLVSRLGQHSGYSLIVVGELFLNKSSDVRKRLSSEFRSFLADSVKTPVVGSDELKKELRSSARVYFRLALYLAVAVLMLTAVFTNQESVLSFLNGEEFKSFRLLSIAALLIFIPVFAYAYGSTARQILKFFKFD